jgi:hypothetical protein
MEDLSPKSKIDVETWEWNFDELSVDQIDNLIEWGYVTEQEVVHFYRNEQWRETP